MLRFLTNLVIAILLFSCKPSENKTVHNRVKYYSNNQDQFTFLVFEKDNIDSFMTRYEPLNAENAVIIRDIKNILTNLSFELPRENSENKLNYTSNTQQPDVSSYELAQSVIQSTIDSQEYFLASLSYLFFYKCLPDSFTYKWHQTTLGHFEFNATFFSLLRDNNKELDEIIYGERGYWDEKLKPILNGETIYNEITDADARTMKLTIQTNTAFNDARFQADKEKFIAFLDNVISNKWRLILIDWN